MSRRNFAKKFVAYSMAFAVAFSTITVSPVFVKEAKAAVEYTVETVASGSAEVISNGKAILDSSSVKSNVNQTNLHASAKLTLVNDLAEAVGMKDNMINPDLAMTEDQTIAGDDRKSNVTLKYDEFVFDETKLKDGPTAVTAPGTTVVKNVILDKDTVVLEADDSAGDYSWYKLIPAKGKLERTGLAMATGDKTVDETITFDYYVFSQINDTGASFDLNTVTSDEAGLYVAVKNTLGTADNTTKAKNYTFFQVVEDSTLEAAPERTNYYAKEGESVDLVVNATSNKSTISYKWYKGVTPLASTSNVCTIDKVDGTTRGIYTCVVDDGVKKKTIGNINVASYTAVAKPEKEETGPTDSIKYTSVVKCLVDTVETYHDDVIPPNTYAAGVDTISGGKVTLTSCVPKSDDYVYVWTVDSSDMSETDIVNYSASNNSITIVDDAKDTNYFADKTTYTCYVLNKDEYTEEVATALSNVALAKSDIEKFRANTLLRTAEAGITDIAKLALFEETFYLLDASNKVISSENIVKKLGDSVKVEAPTTTASSSVNTIYLDDVATDKATATLSGDATEVGKVYAKTNLYASDFGTVRFVVANDALDSTKDTAADATYTPGMVYYDGTGKVVTDVTEFNYASKMSSLKRNDYNVVAEKFVNIVYDSDLTLSAEDVTAKVGSKVTLKANATSKLPIEYSWDFSTMDSSTVDADTKDHSKTAEFTLLAGDIYKPEKDVNENGIIDAGEGEDNYVLCTAFNGIERKTVKIKINQLGGFTYVDKDNTIRTSVENLNNTYRTYNVYALEGKDFTLSANVTPNEGTELTYAWYKDSVGGTPLSTEKTYTTKEAALNAVGSTPVSFFCVVAEKDAAGSAKTFTYNVYEAGISANDIKIKKIEPQKYTGKAIEPALTVSLTEGFVGDLVAGTDYTVAYENNVNTGIARVTVTLTDKVGTAAKGITAEATFAIDRADNEVKLADVTANVGGNVKPVVTDLAEATITTKFYADKDLTKEVTEAFVKANVGTYYAQATAQATTNYNAAKSNVATIVVKGLGTTSSLAVTARTSNTMTVKYAKVAGAAGYRIYVKNVKTNYAWKVVKETTALTYKVTGLPAGYNTAVAVRAYDANKVLAPKYASVTKRTAPGTTSKVTITTSKNAAKLTWKKVTGATHYRVYVKKAGKWTVIANTNKNTFTKTGLKRRTTYTFAVKAYNSTDKLWADKYVAKSAKTK